ncbi:MAG: hypothetical protein AB2L21_02440 [Anaerolineaceae bacterium]
MYTCKLRPIFLLLIILSLLLTACSTSSQVPDATATLSLPTTFLSAETVQSTGATTETPITPSGPYNPTPTLNYASPNPVQISEMQFIQQDNRLVVVAKFQNIYEEAILRNVQFEVLALDAAGNRIAQEIGSIEYLFPRQTSGLVRTFDLISGVETNSVEIHFNGGIMDTDLDYRQPFTITNPVLFTDSDEISLINGWLTNEDDLTYTEIELNAVAYNANGEIIGGGNTYAEFVPAEDKIGISIPSLVSGTAVRVEIYPWISAYSASLEGGSWWNNIKVENWNFAVTADRQIAGGAELINITDKVLTGTYYIITVYDDQDRVCLVDKNFINFMLPGETLYFSPGILSSPPSSEPAHVDMLIIPGEFGEYDLAYNPLVTSQALLFADQDTLTVQVSVLNNLNASISTALITVVLEDEKGNIIGGGQAYASLLPANSSAQVEIPVIIVGNFQHLIIKSSATLPPTATIIP